MNPPSTLVSVVICQQFSRSHERGVDLFRPTQSTLSSTQLSPTKSQGKSPTQSLRKTQLRDDSDDDMALPVINSKADGRVTRARSQSRAVSVEPPPTKQTKGKGRAQPARGAKKSKPLFIESDEEEEDVGGGSGLSAVQEDDDDFAAGFDSDDDDTATLPTTGRRTQKSQKSQKSQGTKASKAKGKKRNAVMLDDDSDDGYKGLGGYKKRR